MAKREPKNHQERRDQDRANLGYVINALTAERRRLVDRAMKALEDDKVPRRLAVAMANVQAGIDAAARAILQHDLESEQCHPAEYLFRLPKDR
nr:hypothetical protein [uncultured Dongia sp.]